jgi:hypothetical protein
MSATSAAGATMRRATSLSGLERLLAAIESGREAKPEWIALRGECRLERLGEARLAALVPRLHRAVLQGFRAPEPERIGKARRLALWRTIAARGFHDFGGDGFTKCWDSPFVEDYDYVAAYLRGGLGALDPFMVYSAVLGTHDFAVHDFVTTALCEGVGTVIEPMAGSADFTYQGHFRHPELRYVMFDLDPKARDFVSGQRWLDTADWRYWIANVLDEKVWKRIASLTSGRSLSYIGKQSHHYLEPKDLLRLLELGTRHVDYFMLEVQEPALIRDLEREEDLSRPEMEDAGFSALLVDDPGVRPNPLTHHLSFSLELRQGKGRQRETRQLFHYPDWTSYQPVTLCAFAKLLGLRVYYFEPEAREFRPIERAGEPSAGTHDVNFLVFTRHRELRKSK